MKKIAVLGSGAVGETLSNGFLKHGYAVMRGSREPSKLADWQKAAKGETKVGTFAEAAAWGELVILAVKGDAAEAVVALAGPANLASKAVLDTTNPIAPGGPTHGVLTYFTEMNDSLMERLQRAAPAAHFVKAFSSVGNAVMVNPKFATPPSMFICGNDAGAKKAASEILKQFGWETEDMGGVEAARAIEPLCILWCIPGFARNEWTHALKLLHA